MRIINGGDGFQYLELENGEQALILDENGDPKRIEDVEEDIVIH